MAASKILEVRVHAASTPPVDKRSGVPLMRFAFGDRRQQCAFRRRLVSRAAQSACMPV